MPQDLSGGRFQRHEVPFRVSREDQPSGGRQYARPCRRWMLPLPLQRTGQGIDRSQRAPERRGVIVWKIRAAVIGVTLFERLRRRAENVALLARVHIK